MQCSFECTLTESCHTFLVVYNFKTIHILSQTHMRNQFADSFALRSGIEEVWGYWYRFHTYGHHPRYELVLAAIEAN